MDLARLRRLLASPMREAIEEWTGDDPSLGAWLSARFAALSATPGSTAREEHEREAQRHEVAPLEFREIYRDLGLPQQTLLRLSARAKLAPIVSAITEQGDDVSAFWIVATLNYCHVDELVPLHALVASSLHALLLDIEEGRLQIVPEFQGSPREGVGALSYACSNGWRLEVYDRAFRVAPSR